MQSFTDWNRHRQEAVLAVDELLERWEELENKKKLVNASLLELRKDFSLLTRELNQSFH